MNTNQDTTETTQESNVETFGFSADINQVLSLVINAIYTDKEIFLRELISNASDALNKIRYQSLTDSTLLDSDQNLEIKISFDKSNKVLIIQDSGIGMTKDDLVNFLGIIANSGTKQFMEAITSAKDASTLIGQFGIGFLSSFLVSSKVIVITKANNSDQFIWESTGNGSFTIQKDDLSGETVARGTIIMLYLKDDMLEYLEENTVINLIKKHNQFIEFPIYVETEKTREVEVEIKSDKKEDDDIVEEDGDVEEGKAIEVDDNDNEEKPEEKPTTITEKYTEYEQINKEKPLWSRNSKEITEDEYTQFYKSFTGDYDNYLDVTHFNVEGQVEYKGLLFVPKRAPHDLFDNTQKKSQIKLYVKKVFITDNCDDIVPDYLKFVKGIVESDDVPLNISREMLQQNKVMKVIGKSVVKKIIDMCVSISEDVDKFRIFYEQYSKNIKLGIHEDATNRTKLCGLLRYETTNSNGDQISLDDYIDNMKEGQQHIYYISGESTKSIVNSPFLERLKKKEYEVVYMIDALDEYIIQQVKDYKDKKLVNITKENLDLNDDEQVKQDFEKAKEDYKPVCEYFKNTLSDLVEKVVVSNKLDDSPCILSTSEYGWSSNMQRIMKAQTFGKPEMSFMMGKKILEINPNNKIVQKIKQKLDADMNDKTVKDLVFLLHDITLQASGFTLEDPSTFNKRILKLINLGLGLDDEPEPEPEPEADDTVMVDEADPETGDNMENVD
jgi:molecular chaperone HtpG